MNENKEKEISLETENEDTYTNANETANQMANPQKDESVIVNMTASIANFFSSWIFKGIKFLASAGTLIYFIYKIATEWDEIANAFMLFGRQTNLIVAEVVLMIANVLLEGLRWHVLCRRADKHTAQDDISTAMLAMAYSSATPGGVGEHIARIRNTKSEKTVVICSLSMTASCLQTATIALLGATSVLLLKSFLDVALPDAALFWTCIATVACLALAFAGIFVFKPMDKMLMLSWEACGGWGIAGAALINIIRVSVFSFQMSLLLGLGEFPSAELMLMVFVYYFLLTLCPRLPMIDLGIKYGIGITVFGGMVEQSVTAASIMFIYFINVCLPGLFGLIVSFFNRRQMEYEEDDNA